MIPASVIEAGRNVAYVPLSDERLDKVFRAMLQALADEYGRIGAFATETKLLEILGEVDGG